MRSLFLVIDLVLLLAMFCLGFVSPTWTVWTGIAIQGSFLLTVYGDFTSYFVRHISGFLIGALVFVLLAGITLLIPLVLPCLMLSACVKTALHIISRLKTMKHASQQWQPAQPRPIRRKEALRQRRCFKKVFREQAKQYRRMRSDYGERAAWLYYHPAARHLVNVLIDTAVSLMIGLLWTCVAVVLTTFLRILLALVIYAMALVVVGTVFWFIAVLLWWLCISGTSTHQSLIHARSVCVTNASQDLYNDVIYEYNQVQMESTEEFEPIYPQDLIELDEETAVDIAIAESLTSLVDLTSLAGVENEFPLADDLDTSVGQARATLPDFCRLHAIEPGGWCFYDCVLAHLPQPLPPEIQRYTLAAAIIECLAQRRESLEQQLLHEDDDTTKRREDVLHSTGDELYLRVLDQLDDFDYYVVTFIITL